MRRSAKYLKSALNQTCTRGSAQETKVTAERLYTAAEIRAATKEGVRRFKDLKSDLKSELHDVTDKIPLLVRSIWGKQSETVVKALRQRQEQTLKQLIRSWKDAEHRLIAVANSLTSLQMGQKLLTVGVPLAASQLMRRDASVAHCFQAPTMTHKTTLSTAELSLQSLILLFNQIATIIAEEIAILMRGAFLFFLFAPVAISSPCLKIQGEMRERWLRLLLWTLERAGPAFIKWGQWAATRPDLFPQDVCSCLATLQTKAPSHESHHSIASIERAFKCDTIDELFAEFDPEPVASGSIAQVHRAVLTSRGAALANADVKGLGWSFPLKRPRLNSRRRRAFSEGSVVAIKVRHPGAAETMERDFALMQRLATLLSMIPGCPGGPQFKESMMQFGAPLRDQMDLRSEAAHLNRFTHNFSAWKGVTFPLPAADSLVSAEVLVESFEEGQHISNYVDAPPGKYYKRLAGLGLNCYLKMLLRDNFIHADLHPGNILVRLEGLDPDTLIGKLATTAGLGDVKIPRLVLLDVGMIAKLSNDDQLNLVNFFKSLTSMNGAAVADTIMGFAHEIPADPKAFRTAMDQLFNGLDPETLRLQTQDIIGDMMETVRQHGVHIQGAISTVVITTMVLEGWSTKLDPDIRILDTIKDILPGRWRERMTDAVDNVMGSGVLALV